MQVFGAASETVRCCDVTDGTEEFRTMAENLMKDSRTLIAELRSEIDRVIGPHLEAVENFALVDFPNHPNVGDSAIWLGEETYLEKKLGRAPSYVCTYDTWSKEDFEKAVPVGPILIHGGGNFGDLWPSHQEFRLKLLSEFPDRQIIQLPQTIHFSSTASLKQAADIINSHKIPDSGPRRAKFENREKGILGARRTLSGHGILPGSAELASGDNEKIVAAASN